MDMPRLRACSQSLPGHPADTLVSITSSLFTLDLLLLLLPLLLPSFDHGSTHVVVLDVSQSQYEAMLSWLYCDLVAIGMPPDRIKDYTATIGTLGLKKPLRLGQPVCPTGLPDPGRPLWLVAVIHHAPYVGLSRSGYCM
jgi:hypothetical protein